MKENIIFGLVVLFIAALLVAGAFSIDWITGSFIK